MTIKTDKIILNAERNVSLVTMVQTVTGELNVGKRPAILVLPGGGYAMCSDREAEVVAYPYLAAGYHAFVLRYSVAQHNTWPNPLDDYEQAMEYILKNAEEWGIAEDKIAVAGFSAGGHLAACAATQAKHRPNAAILGYAATEQDIASACQPGTEIPSPTLMVDSDTPPCFIFAARDDAIVPVKNPANFMSALDKYGINFESHIYLYGGHGFSTGEAQLGGQNICRRIPDWVKDSIGFLEDIFGVLTPAGLEKPVCLGKINGDTEKYLSVQCSIAHLKKCTAAGPVLAPFFAKLNTIADDRFGGNEAAHAVFGVFKLLEVLKMFETPQEEIDSIDAALGAISNEGITK